MKRCTAKRNRQHPCNEFVEKVIAIGLPASVGLSLRSLNFKAMHLNMTESTTAFGN